MLKQTEKLFRVTHGISYIFLSALLFIVTVTIGIYLITKPTITSLASAVTEDPLSSLNNLTSDGAGGCSFTGTVTNAHSATISIGESSADFGTTKITTVCSNSLDHQVYAVGYSNETEGNTNLINTVDNTLTIPTGIEQGNISNWSMKISKDTSSYLPENLTLENNFDSNHVVPNESTLISSYTGGTDTTTGSSILTTYSANVANNQIAGNYAGVVKYTLTATTIYNITIKTTEGIDKVTLNNVECTSTEGCVVPNLISGQSYTLEVTPSTGYEFTGWNAITSGTIADSTVTSTTYTIGNADEVLEPEAERIEALLDTGENVNMKMKSVAKNATVSYTSTSDTLIKSFQRSNTLPNDFVATTTNTISLTTSKVPIYIFFDNTDNAGIMYYYARDNVPIVANSTLSYLFRRMTNLTEVPGLADWNTGNVTDMSYMFNSAASLTDISGLANWDTAKVTNMSYMFYSTKIANVDALVPNKNNNPNIWNTGNVTNMGGMFNVSSLTDISGLSNWDTAKVTNMNSMFVGTKITNVDALVPNKNNNPNIWNTGNVTSMTQMFYASSLTDISGLANWDTAKVTYMGSMFRSTKITNVDALVPNKNNNPNIWNTGNVTDMSYMFSSAKSLTDISDLANWDTAKVTDMSWMFDSTKITNVDALIPNKNNNPNIWNTGNVTNMSHMFQSATSLTDISGLAHWDTAKVTNMSNMFYNASSLADISPIAGWNVSKVTATAGGTTSSNNKFYQMFYSVPSNVTSGFVFTNRAGSINSNGTYVPSA